MALALLGCCSPHGSTKIVDGRDVPAAKRYCEEFAGALSVATHWNTGEELESPYYYLHGWHGLSPDGTWSLDQQSSRCYWHTLTLEHAGGTAETVLVIREADPGSGKSHGCQWSQDSKAVFIYGSGTPAGHEFLRDAAFVYLVEQKTLYSVDLTPFLAERLEREKEQERDSSDRPH